MTPKNKELLEKVLEIIGDRRWEKSKYASPSICSFDLFFLVSLARWVDAKNIVEFGCGSTTAELSDQGFNLTTYSLGKSEGASKLANVNYIECDITDLNLRNSIMQKIDEADLLVIDADHSDAFAKYYHQNFLMDCKVPVWIHDYWTPRGGRVPYGEQGYLDAHVLGKTHEMLIQTDLPPDACSVISERIGFDILPQRRTKPFNQKDGPKMCAMVLKR